MPPTDRTLSLAAALAACLSLSACKPKPSPLGASPPGSASAQAPAGAEAAPSPQAQGRIAHLRSAENRRDAASVSEADVTSPEPQVRRAAARALARIASDEARGPLLRLLSDDDGETAAFAAYGLGWTCAGHEDENVGALAARAATMPATSPPPAGAFDPVRALARALGRCATADAEATLAGWLKGPRPRAQAAALGLGDLVARRKAQDETLVALSQAASGGPSSPPLPEALFPFGRVDAPSPAVAQRVREVAIARLGDRGETRLLAIRALGRTDGEAAAPLGKLLSSPGDYSDLERAEAAKALGRLGDRGQAEIGEALPALVPATDAMALSGLVSDGMGPRLAALEALASPAPRAAREALAKMAKLPIPDGSTPPASVVRRLVRLRCLAARALAAPGAVDDPLVKACDPDEAGEEGALARLWVLGKEPLKGPKKRAAFKAFFASPSAKVRASAFELLASHREVDEAAQLVAEGLKSPHPGTMAAAAEVLVARPDLGSSLEAALLAALDRKLAPDDVETVAKLAQAAGAAHVAGAKKHLEALCQSFSPTLRATAQASLGLLGEKNARCRSAPPRAEPAPELGKAPAGRPRVVLDTDAGELTLELSPSLAPTAAERLIELASSGFYDDMAIHRVVPGFVVQFGDRGGDGTGGAGREPLRCETSPLPFEALSVGVALAGRDTGSGQFFVTLSRVPHLDGEYALVGQASGDWAAVVEGDRIRKARVVP